jgi:hypothetical protein
MMIFGSHILIFNFNTEYEQVFSLTFQFKLTRFNNNQEPEKICVKIVIFKYLSTIEYLGKNCRSCLEY